MTPTVLLYNLSGTDAGRKLKPVLLKLRIRIRIVERESYLETIGHLAGIEGMEASGQEYKEEGFSDPMLIMCGFSGELLDLLLAQMRKSAVPPIPLKAMLTPHNMFWNSLALHDELTKDHEAMKTARQNKK